MNFTLKFSFFVVLACALIMLIKQGAKTGSVQTQVLVSGSADVITMKMNIDFYSQSCPLAEDIIRSTFKELYEKDHDIAPALIRMLFHDCFVHGCDASVLLVSGDGIKSEQKARPNLSLRKFEVVNTIKSRLEERCPGVVSCADILVLAARESVIAAGGPFYPISTGRRDSTNAFLNESSELPSPFDGLEAAVASFASKGFSEQELVTLLGAHSVGEVRCEFINPRLHNFNSTGGPDLSIDPEFLKTLRATCNGNDDPVMRMDYEGIGQNFGTLYYNSLLKRKGLTSLDQQMTSNEETERIVSGYASDAFEFQKEFSAVMAKLSTLHVLTAPMGEIRRNCSRVNSHT